MTASFVTLSKTALNNKNLLSAPIAFAASDVTALVQRVMNPFDCVVNVHCEFFGHLDVCPSPGIVRWPPTNVSNL